MPQPVDVGSVLGGRYKVTAHVVVSAEHDVVLDGIDQVLNRPVSILLAAPENSDHLAQSAREVATGERQANVSILDLGKSDGATYLIANQTPAAELLDLVVPTAPYVEPFFTDTLGTEIFGAPRAAAPGPQGAYDYVYEDDSPVAAPAAGLGRPSMPPLPAAPPAPPRSRPATAPTSIPGAAAAAARPEATAPVPHTPLPAEKPKVSLWTEEDYEQDDYAAEPAIVPAKAAPAPAPRAAAPVQTARAAATLPAPVREASDFYDDDDDVENAPRTSGRWLTGGIVAILIVAALIFALTNISSLFGSSPTAAPQPSQTQGTTTSGGSESSAAPSATAPVPPVINQVTRYMPEAPSVGDQFDYRLPQMFDQNPGTFWTTLEFSNDSFAGLADSINLIVELKAPSDISSITLSQIGGSGGAFNVLTNTAPTMDGATTIGSGSFSAPDFTLKAPAGTKAQYVIINFTQLPRISPFVTYPYSIKIAEIGIK
ncbi:hypothetical protein [Arthrobacter sp. 35W]|uniref:hypothetical protein n=1 Tax=Arthrobacter sp. 35W TaxID=1132441 RepID=UPI00040A362A|nr:hypothetical protein [Arthrobacter sp. 35W]